jgi:putative FmdB family regulatory protein
MRANRFDPFGLREDSRHSRANLRLKSIFSRTTHSPWLEGLAKTGRFSMPTYDYACPKCGYTFELVQSMRDEPIKKCPKCKKTGVKRLIGGGSGLIFKGTGFYITDYKNKKPAGAKEGGGEAKPAASDSKPAAPAASSPSASTSVKK